MYIDNDAFSSGQIGSKVWLCKHLDRFLRCNHSFSEGGFILWVYGGWVGVLPLLFLARGLPVKRIINFDMDEESLKTADMVNNYWRWKGVYRGIQQDLAEIDFNDIAARFGEPEPHVVINTAVEHMKSRRWYESIPSKKALVLQSTDMKHDDHVVHHKSVEDLQRDFPIQDLVIKESLSFDYGNPTSFHRFMTIGFK